MVLANKGTLENLITDYPTWILATLWKSPKSKTVITQYIKSPRYFSSNLDQEIYSALLTIGDKESKVAPIVLHRLIKKNDITMQTITARIEDFKESNTIGILSLKSVLLEFTEQLIAEKITDELEHTKVKLKTKTDVYTTIDTLVEKIKTIRDYTSSTELVDKDSQAERYLANLRKRMNKEIETIPFFTPNLNRATGVIEGSDLIYVGARPSMGKTQFGVVAARYYAKILNIPTLFLALEMPDTQILMRLTTAATGYSFRNLKAGCINEYEFSKVEEYIQDEFKKIPLYIEDRVNVKLAEIANKISHYKHYYKAKIIIIDYVQLIRPDNPKQNKSDYLEEISQKLKIFAREFDVIIIGMLQLNREVTAVGRSDPKPKLSDLRGSGSFEQDADTVMFLHRPAYYGKTSENGIDLTNITEVIVAKDRGGVELTNQTVRLLFDKRTMLYTDYDEEIDRQQLNDIYESNRLKGVL